MTGPIVFISHFKIKEGKLNDVKQLSENVSNFIEANRPGTVAFLQFTNVDGTELSILHVFPDADAFDKHLEGAGERSNKAFEVIIPTRRELYGQPSDQAVAMLTPPEGSDIIFKQMSDLAAGYIRLQGA